MKAMILAAGLGTRLRPFTSSIPKPLLPVAGRSLIEWNLHLLRRHGVTDVMINVHYLGQQILDHLGDGRQLGMRLSYSKEPVLLGTGGGIKQVESFFGNHPFWVINGDTLATIDLTEMAEQFRAKGGMAMLALRDDPQADQWGAVETDEWNRVLAINGRGQVLDNGSRNRVKRMFAGFHILDPLLLRDISPGIPSSIIDAYVSWLEKDAGIFGYVFRGYWSDVGTPGRYAQVQRDVENGLLP